MFYKQKVVIKNIEYVNVVSAFQNLKFIKFLIKWQPVKIVKWDGIYNNDMSEPIMNPWFPWITNRMRRAQSWICSG